MAIDQRNSQWQEISDGLPAGTDLLLLDSDRSGLSQIQEALQAGQDAGLGYSSLAVIGSEGSDGLLLGSDSLTGGESELAELGDDLIGDMRVKLFSDGIAPSAAEPAAVDPQNQLASTRWWARAPMNCWWMRARSAHRSRQRHSGGCS